MNFRDTLEIADNIVWINARPYNRDNIRRGQFLSKVQEAVQNLDQKLLNSLPVVLDTRHEGQGQREYEMMIAELTNEPWFDVNRCFWVNNVFVDDQPRVISVPWQMTNHSNYLSFIKEIERDWNTLERKHKFVCLMRRQSPSRTQLAVEIIKKFAPEQYVLTCSSMAFWETFDYENNIKFPILLDGRVDTFQQHGLNHPDVFDCLINAVVETSNQTDAETLALWDSIFITEKTFKAFAWRQIPIWFAVPGTVDKIRTAGFDVFDDLFHNHDYDTIQNQAERFTTVLNYINEIMHQSLDIKTLIPRFQNNFDVLNRLDHNPNRSDQYIAKLILQSYTGENLRG